MKTIPMKLKTISNATFLEIEEEIEETTTTAATPGYDSKNAFKKRKEQPPIIDIELADDKGVSIHEGNVKLEGEGINEMTRADREWNDKNPKQKVGSHIKSVVTELKRIEKILKEAEKIKQEGGLKSGSYWVRTKKGLSQISERMAKIGHTIKRLQS
jgi:hypothetical protein